MKQICLFLCCITCCALGFMVNAQQAYMLKKEYQNSVDTFFIKKGDSLFLPSNDFIEPQSIRIDAIDTGVYHWVVSKNAIVFKQKTLTDTIRIQYRTTVPFLKLPYRNKTLGLVDSNIAAPMQFYLPNDTSLPGYVHFNSLDYNGSYGRSLMVGNNQDVSLNSNFNLQLNGYILDSIRIEASITDNSIPFQPDGTTYQLQEFDKIYITFEKGNHKLTAGDFNIFTPTNSYFLQYNKRVQGLGIGSTQQINKSIKNTIQASGSIAKGQFARNIFNGLEGNQGPYKLRGNNGEQYFIVLAGSERVFIDGQLLQRGEDRDYIINYNTGEITFMPRQLITKDKRIQIDFEYQDRNYLNSLFQVSDVLEIGKKLQLRWNVYSNQDAKNQSFMQDLDDEQKMILRNVGDDIEKAFYRQMNVDTFDASKILYRMEQRTVNGMLYDSVFVYSANPDSTLYRLNFTNVGPNNGHYIISDAATNGRSYTWVAPVNGVPQGEYEPVVLIISPKKHQVFSMGGTYQFSEKSSLNIELASSNYDPNLFAPNISSDHWGYAGKMLYKEERNLSKQDSNKETKWALQNELNFEYVQSQFKAIAPYRNIEFARDYNVDTTVQSDEYLMHWNTKLKYKSQASLGYQFSYFTRANTYNATRHQGQLTFEKYGFKTIWNTSLLNADGTTVRSVYWRPNIIFERKFEKIEQLVLGAQYEAEVNEIFDKIQNNKAFNSFKFDTYRFYLKNAETEKIRINIQYVIRQDDSIRNDVFTKNNYSKELNAKLGFYQLENHTFQILGSYRNLNVIDTNNKNAGITETILGRLEYNGNFAKSFIVTSLMYELGTGQEQKRAYTFVEVDAGLGMYMWVDYNNDNIQQINEFELALYQDQKRFIKVFTPTNKYVNVNYMNLSYSLQINPENILRNKKQFWAKFITRFNDQLSVQMNNRAYQSVGMKAFNPFTVSSLGAGDIINNIISINNVLYFNRINPKFGIDYATIYNLGNTLLTYGVEKNDQERHTIKTRWTFISGFTYNMQLFNGHRSYYSGLPDDRTYKVAFQGVEPALTWMLQSRIRLTIAYKFEERNNDLAYGGEYAKIQSYGIDGKWNMKNNSAINAKFTYTSIYYDGALKTSKAFVMLDALQNGNNWIWNLNWNIRLSRGIELTLDYDGRKPANEKIIHTGRMSIRALL